MQEQSQYNQTEIGPIPKDWLSNKLGKKICLEYGKGLTEVQRKRGKYPVFGSNGIVGYHDDFLVEGPGIVVGRKGTIGAITWSDVNFWPIDTTYYVKLLDDDVYLRWLYYKLDSMGLPKLNMATGTPGLNRDLAYSQNMLLPPLPEQRRIAEILGTADEAIEQVAQAIEKAERLKQGLMQELLTKGIGHKDFKESDIGRIPKGWEVVNLGDVAEVKGGKRLPLGHSLLDQTTPYPYIRVVDLKNMSVDSTNLKYLSPESHSLLKGYTVSSADVYISIAGTIGLAGCIPPNLDGANLTENAAKLCRLKSIDKIFLAYVLNSGIVRPQIISLTGKATQPKLALFRIEKIKLPLPSPSEQKRIVGIMDGVVKDLEVKHVRKARLVQIKKGLMTDLLTGKRRVRV